MANEWMLDELAHAGPEHLDPAFVASYERKQGYSDPAADLAVLAAHGLDGTSTVVDLGAGTGRFSLAAAGRFGQVIAVDISPAMLGLLGERAAAAGVSNLRLVQAGFLSYRHHGRPAEAVFERWLEGAADDPARGYTRADLATHIRTEHSTFRWLLEPMLAAAGFELLTADFRGSVYGAYTCRLR